MVRAFGCFSIRQDIERKVGTQQCSRTFEDYFCFVYKCTAEQLVSLCGVNLAFVSVWVGVIITAFLYTGFGFSAVPGKNLEETDVLIEKARETPRRLKPRSNLELQGGDATL